MISDDDIRAWLKTKEISPANRVGPLAYNCIKAALIASTHPFGLFGDYIGADGKRMYFCNGKLSTL